MAIDGNRLFAGQSWISDGDAKGPLGLAVVNLKDLNVKYLGEVEGFPGAALTTLELDGTNLWIGGRGYIARLDTKDLKVRKYSYIPTRNVNRIQVGGGYVWAQYNWHLHRAALNDLD